MEVEEPNGLSHQELVFPYVYGSLAFSLGKKGESYTHRWICYVRGVNNEDLSYLIHKVVFKLHSSFANPFRGTPLSRSRGPETTLRDSGGGLGRVRDQYPNPLQPPDHASRRAASHAASTPPTIQLHHTHTSGSQQSKKPLCSEVYDEIIFTQMDVPPSPYSELPREDPLGQKQRARFAAGHREPDAGRGHLRRDPAGPAPEEHHPVRQLHVDHRRQRPQRPARRCSTVH